MRQLHPEAIAAIQSKALFSQIEEALLAKISSVSQHFFSHLGRVKKNLSDIRNESTQNNIKFLEVNRRFSQLNTKPP